MKFVPVVTQELAALVLAMGDPEAEAAAPVLIDALKDEEPFVRGSAAEAHGKIGAGAQAAVPALMDALEDQGTSAFN